MSRSCPRTCAMEITQQIRHEAAKQGITEEQVAAEGMAAKSDEFRSQGGEIYTPA